MWTPSIGGTSSPIYRREHGGPGAARTCEVTEVPRTTCQGCLPGRLWGSRGVLALDNMVTEREDRSCASVGSWWWPLRGMCCSPALSKPLAGPYATLRSGALGRVLALCPGPVILMEGLWPHRLPPSASKRAVTQAAGAAAAWRGSLRPQWESPLRGEPRILQVKLLERVASPPQGDLPNPGSNPCFLWLLHSGASFTTAPPGKSD